MVIKKAEKKRPGRRRKEVVRLQINISQELASTLDALVAYLSMDTRQDGLRYLMSKGLEQFRMGQSVRDQADMFGKFVNAFSEEMDHAAKRGGSSSTATGAQKCPPLGNPDEPLPFPKKP